MDDITNVLGAVIFWLYNVAALTFTALTIGTILRLRKSTSAQSSHLNKNAGIFVVLACGSFATLSFNMLHVLIQSYKLWAASRSIASPSTLGSLLGNIRRWSLTSTLFLDFGEAIVANDGRYLWTQSSLLATLSVGLFMASQGYQRNIPHLWTFFALAQILPISFAQNLFYIALLYAPRSTAQRTAFPTVLLFASLTTYVTCLLTAPQASRMGHIIETILAVRGILQLPLLFAETTPSGMHHPSSSQFPGGLTTARTGQYAILVCSVLLTCKQSYALVVGNWTLSDVLLALLEHPAVTSLGMDFILSVSSSVAWATLIETDKTASAKHTKVS